MTDATAPDEATRQARAEILHTGRPTIRAAALATWRHCDADDISSDAIGITIFTWTAVRNPVGYAVTVAVRLALRRYHHLLILIPSVHDPALLDRADPTVELPDEITVRHDHARRVQAVVHTLPERHQIVLHLAAETTSYEELGRRLGVNPNTARMRLARARTPAIEACRTAGVTFHPPNNTA